MIDDIFIFDNVIHCYDMSDANMRTDRDDAQHARNHLLSLGYGTRLPAYNEPGQSRYDKKWSLEELYDMVFVQAPTDMAMAQVVPIFDWFKDWFAPIKTQHAMAQKYPDRVLFCGGADPQYRGLVDALNSIEWQIKDLGAKSIKFYNGHVERAWRCDDEKLAYPLYEKTRQLGVKVVQFHKGLPFGKTNLEVMSPLDIQAAARDFPDMNFIIHHLGFPYFNESIWVANRFENVYLALSGTLNMLVISPRAVQEQMGRLLMEVGVDKLMWGSEAALAGGPAPYLKAFMEMEIPEDLRSGYGYPQITREDKEKILGLNFAKMMGIDVEAKKRELAGVAA